MEDDPPGDHLYIRNPPVPKDIPCDLATIRLLFYPGHYNFEMVSYRNPLEWQEALEAEEFNEVMAHHESEWLRRIF